MEFPGTISIMATTKLADTTTEYILDEAGRIGFHAYIYFLL